MLAITQLALGAHYNRRPDYTLNLGSTYNLELFDWAKASTGWNGVDACKMTVTIVPGAIIGSTHTGAYALYIRNFPSDCELIVDVQGNAWIVGCGGAGGAGGANGPGGTGGQGGPAIYAGSRCTIANNGLIAAGGGGGGGGGGCYHKTSSYTLIRGGGGGGGGAGQYAGAGGVCGPIGQASSRNPTNGTAANMTSPGSGGVGCRSNQNAGGGDGNVGGGLGAAGTTGGTAIGFPTNYAGGAGGSTNYAIYGNANITWLATGDIRGWIA